MSETDSVELTQREIKLLIKYGYPFDEVSQQLEKVASIKGTHIIEMDEDEANGLIADLVYSAKSINSPRLLEEIDEICSVLEHRF